jgi:hypothetical protein
LIVPFKDGGDHSRLVMQPKILPRLDDGDVEKSGKRVLG